MQWLIGIGTALGAILLGILAMVLRRPPPLPRIEPAVGDAHRESHEREVEHIENDVAAVYADADDVLSIDDRVERAKAAAQLDG